MEDEVDGLELLHLGDPALGLGTGVDPVPDEAVQQLGPPELGVVVALGYLVGAAWGGGSVSAWGWGG